MKKTFLTTTMAIGVLCLGGNALATDYNAGAFGSRPAFSDMRDGAGKPAAPGNPGSPAKMRPPDESFLQGNLEMLQLTDKQELAIKDMEKRYSGQSSPYRDKLRQLEKELMQESLQKAANRARISMLSDMIGKQHVRLALVKSVFFKELASMLSPEQLSRMTTLRERPMPPSR
ncbi:MAG: hypothetical protein FJZ79_02085 [Chlorobi bacterium]|nr:hypothetical protein [Chlorobiota bacterium]